MARVPNNPSAAQAARVAPQLVKPTAQEKNGRRELL